MRVSDDLFGVDVQQGMTGDRAQEIMRWDINGFNGLINKDTNQDLECNSVWTQKQRDWLSLYLQQAEQKREQQVGYHLGKKVVFDEQHQVPPHLNPYTLDKKHLLDVGYPTLDDLQLGEILTGDYAAGLDPVEIVVTTDVSTDEIIVCYPGENVQIRPSSVKATTPTYGSRYVTIKIPWARLIKPELNDDREDHLQYSDTTNYLETVDVKRYWFDKSLGAQYVWLNGCCCENFTSCSCDCEPNCQTACTIKKGDRAPRLSEIWLQPATFDEQTATVTCFTYCPSPDLIQITYVSGKVTLLNELATIKFGFALSPFQPCDCSDVVMYWQDAKAYVPGVLTPYGSTRGAIDAWAEDSQQRIGAGGKLGRRINWAWLD